MSAVDTPGPSANVDPREAAHYAALAEQWWNPVGPFWPLHKLNALRVEYLRGVLAEAFGRAIRTPHAPVGMSQRGDQVGLFEFPHLGVRDETDVVRRCLDSGCI